MSVVSCIVLNNDWLSLIHLLSDNVSYPNAPWGMSWIDEMYVCMYVCMYGLVHHEGKVSTVGFTASVWTLSDQASYMHTHWPL